ncbi:hypothetical protein FGO68_gene2649 [Halteria grandinella]|uniref:Uncharacterized protein n=1 Tax=Halteria grandinella TaxID=5974 RepID=A0A8J8NIT2_HALGN|nr:hypothetical protein FGO68_gene2649 [Halteria grandinella]
MKQSVTLLLAAALVATSFARETSEGVLSRKKLLGQSDPIEAQKQEEEQLRYLQSVQYYYTSYDYSYCQSYKVSNTYNQIVHNFYYNTNTSSRSDYDTCNYNYGGSGDDSKTMTDADKVRLAIAVAVPVALFGVIMVCTICSCICCRPRNQDILEQQNTRIDPLKQIDVNKIKHWTYIRNNIPGSISGQTAAAGMMQQPVAMGQPVQYGQPIPGMMGPPQY